jgi:hypothetical protein
MKEGRYDRQEPAQAAPAQPYGDATNPLPTGKEALGEPLRGVPVVVPAHYLRPLWMLWRRTRSGVTC